MRRNDNNRNNNSSDGGVGTRATLKAQRWGCDVGATTRAASVSAPGTPTGGYTRPKTATDLRNFKFQIANCKLNDNSAVAVTSHFTLRTSHCRSILASIVMLLILCSPAMAGSPDEDSPIRNPGSTTSTSTKSGGDMNDWLRVALSLAAVVGLIYLAKFLIRKSGRASKLSGAGGPVEIIWRSTLTMKQQLILARMGQRLLLLGVGPGGMTTLSELTDPKEITELLASIEQGKADSFTNMLKSKAQQYVAPAVVGQSSAPRDDAGPAGEAARRLAEKLRAMDKREKK